MLWQGARTHVNHNLTAGLSSTNIHTLLKVELSLNCSRYKICFAVHFEKCLDETQSHSRTQKPFIVCFHSDHKCQVKVGFDIFDFRFERLTLPVHRSSAACGHDALNKLINITLLYFQACFRFKCDTASVRPQGGFYSPILHIPLTSQISILLSCCAPACRLPECGSPFLFKVPTSITR